MSNQYESGDVTLTTLTLTSLSTNQTMDITGQVASISLWEDLLQPWLYAEIAMTDAIGLLKTLPIVGEELLTLEFVTPGRASYKTVLHTYGVGDIMANDNQTKHGYILKCISPEKMMDAMNQVEKGYNTTIDKMIQDIITNSLKSNKKFVYEPTKGVQKILFPTVSPFKAIDMITSRAASPINKSSSYFFWENKHGYNFNTLENLMYNNSKNIGDKVFTKYTATAVELQSPLDFRTIHAHTTGRQMDLHGLVDKGGLNNVHQSFDILTKTFKENKYNLSMFNQFSSPDQKGAVSPVTPYMNTKYGTEIATKYFAVHDGGKPDTFINDFFPSKIGFLMASLGTSMSIYINGDSTITAGDCIKIEIPKTSGLTKTQIEPEPLVNGNYIIKEVHHVIQISSMKPKYTQTLGLIKGTYVQ